MSFRAILIEKQDDDFRVGPAELNESDLMPGEVTIRVQSRTSAVIGAG